MAKDNTFIEKRIQKAEDCISADRELWNHKTRADPASYKRPSKLGSKRNLVNI